MMNTKKWSRLAALAAALFISPSVFAGEADIHIPDLSGVNFDGLGGVSGATLMYIRLVICLLGAVFGLVQYFQTKALPVHESMARSRNTIWETCKTYLFTQGKFLAILWVLIAGCMVYYFLGLQHEAVGNVVTHSALLHSGHSGFLWRGVVRHPHQHRLQLAHRLFRAQGQSRSPPWASRSARA